MPRRRRSAVLRREKGQRLAKIGWQTRKLRTLIKQMQAGEAGSYDVKTEGESSSVSSVIQTGIEYPDVVIKEEADGEVVLSSEDVNPHIKQCLVCLLPTKGYPWWTKIGITKNPSCLENHLSSIFLLKKLIGLDAAQCVEILKKTGLDPGHWVMLCEGCSQVFKSGVNIYHQIYQLERKLEEVRKELRMKIDVSIKVSDFLGVQTQGSNVVEMHTLIREYFRVENKNEAMINLTSESAENQVKSELMDFTQYVDINIYDGNMKDTFERDPLSDKASPSTMRAAQKRKKKCSSQLSLENQSSPGHEKKIIKRRKRNPLAKKREPRTTINRINRKLNPNWKYKCDLCPYKGKHMYEVRAHKLLHDLYPEKCDICNYPCRNATLAYRHRFRHTDEPFRLKCTLCDYTTEENSQMKVHMRNHKILDNIELLESEDYKCKLCSIIDTKSNLFSHMKTTHVEELSLEYVTCHICGKLFTTKSAFQGHVRKVHEDYRPHKCHICERAFHNKKDYEDHITIHENGGQNTIICHICGLSYPSRASLRNHLRQFHNKKRKMKITRKSRTLKCKHCSVESIHDKALKLHLKTNHPELYKYKCELCDAAYTQPGGLETHKKAKHLGEKAECPYCLKEFGCKDYLKGHWQQWCKKYPGSASLTSGVPEEGSHVEKV